MTRVAKPVRIIIAQPYTKRLAEYHLHRDGTVYERKQNGNVKLETDNFIIYAVHKKARDTIAARKKWRWFHVVLEAVLTPIARRKLAKQAAQERRTRIISNVQEVTQ